MERKRGPHAHAWVPHRDGEMLAGLGLTERDIRRRPRRRLPRTRGECPTARPCPHVTCRYNTYLEVTDEGGIKIRGPVDPLACADSCALDLADDGGMTRDEIGEVLGLTRERVRQIELSGLEKLAEEGGWLIEFLELGDDVDDDGDEDLVLEHDDAGAAEVVELYEPVPENPPDPGRSLDRGGDAWKRALDAVAADPELAALMGQTPEADTGPQPTEDAMDGRPLIGRKLEILKTIELITDELGRDPLLTELDAATADIPRTSYRQGLQRLEHLGHITIGTDTVSLVRTGSDDHPTSADGGAIEAAPPEEDEEEGLWPSDDHPASDDGGASSTGNAEDDGAQAPVRTRDHQPSDADYALFVERLRELRDRDEIDSERYARDVYRLTAMQTGIALEF